MKASALKYAVLSLAASLCLLIIAVVPFHAFLTVWAASNYSHYTAFRLWKEVILLIISLAALFLLMIDVKIRTHTFTRRLVWLVTAYAGLHVVVGVVAFKTGHVMLKALTYGWLVDLRFLLFFLLVWAVALRTARLQATWQKLILIPAAIVIVFGLLQIFVLPVDFLKHVGYSAMTIEPYETVNSNREYVRIASTLRGPNPLGAYLIIPISAAFVLLLRTQRKWRYGLFIIAGLIVLAASFSRSAAVGLVVSLGLIAVLSAKSVRAKKYLAYAGVCLVALGIIGLIVVGNNTRAQNIILHTQDNSSVAASSNDGHVSAIRHGLRDIVHEPLGRGPGTAGPASAYNDGQARIAENYFLQIGQEVGIVGLTLFVLINAGVGYILWLRRSDPLALSLFVSLVGLSLVAMLSHSWADDTLAYVWWGLAGIALARLPAPVPADPETAPTEPVATKPVKRDKRVAKA